VHMNSNVTDLVNASAFAAHESIRHESATKSKGARKGRATRKAAK